MIKNNKSYQCNQSKRVSYIYSYSITSRAIMRVDVTMLIINMRFKAAMLMYLCIIYRGRKGTALDINVDSSQSSQTAFNYQILRSQDRSFVILLQLNISLFGQCLLGFTQLPTFACVRNGCRLKQIREILAVLL